MSTATSTDECTLGMKVTETRGFYVALTMAAIGFALLTGSANAIVYQYLLSLGVIQGSFYQNAWIAALTEPILTKFLPVFVPMTTGAPLSVGIFSVAAGLVLAGLVAPVNGLSAIFMVIVAPILLAISVYLFFPKLRIFSCVDYPTERWRAAPYTGLIFGIVELYVRNLSGSDFNILFWKMQTFHPNQFAPVLLHLTTGMFIVWAVMSTNRPRKTRYSLALAGLVTGGLIHLIFNTWLQTQPWFWNNFHKVIPL